MDIFSSGGDKVNEYNFDMFDSKPKKSDFEELLKEDQSEYLDPTAKAASAPKTASPETAPDKESGAEVKKKKKKKKKKRKQLSAGARRALTVIVSIILVCVLTFSSVGGYVLFNIVKTVNGDVQIDLNEYKANQSQTTIIYAKDEKGNDIELTRLHGEENRIWVSLDKIPKNLQKAYIALEDKRFPFHSGVDWIRTLKVTLAAFVNPSADSQGGSTITQQLIKNLTGENGKTFIRKFREIQNALNLEKNYSKDSILEAYLNTLYLDAGCYGVETASEYYFGKNVSKLNLAECACIAAITKAPRAYNPILNPEDNKERQLDCLYFMKEQEMISQEEYDEAKDFKLIFTNSEEYVASLDDNGEDGDTLASDILGKEDEPQNYYVDFVIDNVIADFQVATGCSYSEAWRKVYYGGLKIYTAVDMFVQETMENIYYNRLNFPTARNSYGEEIQSCMVIMDYEGRVVGIVGQAGEKTANRCLNIASDSPRQPGSSIKPLSVYSLAIDSDEYSWSYPLVNNYGIMYNGERWPINYGGDPGSPSSYITLQAALAPSYNTVPAQLVYHFGTERCYDWLKDTFHISTLDKTHDMDYSALAVGGMYNGVTAVDLTAAYAVFGNGGKYYKPYSYYRVTNSTGSTVYLAHTDDNFEQAIEPSSAYVMNKMLQTVVTASDGTARAYPVDGFTTFAKTGTTTDNKDYWFVGGTPYYVASVWFGYSQYPEDMTDKVSGKPGGLAFETIMDTIHSDLEEKSFEMPDDVVRKTYCTRTGLIAGSGCYSTATGWYKTSNIPATCTNCSGGAVHTTAAPTTHAGTTSAPPVVTSPPTTAAPVVTEPPVDPEPPVVDPPADEPENGE